MYNARMLAQRLLLSRRDLDWDQKDLSAKSGISQTYISQIERGRKINIGIDVVFSLAEALGVTVPYLLGISDDPLGQSPDHVLKEMAGEFIAVDVEDQEQRKLLQEVIDTLTVLPPRDRRIALDLLRSMRKIEEEDSGPLVPRIIE
jgi:transcriptional regulator with XRE-family HTH domain